MGSIFESLEWEDGQSNPSGIKSVAYIALKADIATFPTFSKETTTPETSVTYATEFVMKTGKKFKTFYSTQGIGKVDFEPTGEKDHKVMVNKASLSYPGLSPQAKALATALLNSNVIVVVPHYSAGGKIQYAVIGGADFDATIDIKGTSGAKAGDQKGLTLEVSATDIVALPNYIGLIELDGGSLNCATGVTTPIVVPKPEPEPEQGA